MLRFNSVEDFRSSSSCSHTPRGSLEELKGFNCAKKSKPQGRFNTNNKDRKCTNKFKSKESIMRRKFDTCQKGKGIQCRECERYGHIQAECTNTLKKNRFMNGTLIFQVIIDLEDTSIHNYHKDDSDDDFIYSDQEVSYEELQDKYNLLYTKWVGLVELHQNLKDSLKKIQEQKDVLEERNYELIAQVKDRTERVLLVDAHPMHHFIDKLTPIVVLPFLTVRNSINQVMEDIDGLKEGFEGEHNAEGRDSSGSDLEVV
ncbi:hypothetical protein M9H77_22388 [Catharanthus roseus]|uniref:Uncharacterized protein n=1 Tax=Catharanthus roseus TaxID=4058 RepID=A0ACC0AS22_CATRO|nr:hypothetical protein M9H77_22388 [Catharanthus roseus]